MTKSEQPVLRLKVSGPRVKRGRIAVPDLIKICQDAQAAVKRQAEALEGRKTLHPGPVSDNIRSECTLELIAIKKGSTTLEFAFVQPQIRLPEAEAIGVEAISELGEESFSLETGGAFETLGATCVTVDSLRQWAVLTPNSLAGGAVSVWDLSSHEKVGEWFVHSDQVNCVLTLGDATFMSASNDGTIKRWRLVEGESEPVEDQSLVGHNGGVRSIAITSRGDRLVSASDDCTLKIWDCKTGVQLITMVGHKGSIRCVCVNPSDTLVLSASDDRTIKVWDLESGEVITSFACDARPKCCSFCGEQRVIAGDEAGSVYVLQLER